LTLESTVPAEAVGTEELKVNSNLKGEITASAVITVSLMRMAVGEMRSYSGTGVAVGGTGVSVGGSVVVVGGIEEGVGAALGITAGEQATRVSKPVMSRILVIMRIL
jgi:Ca2+-dependent lipid-binding protein